MNHQRKLMQLIKDNMQPVAEIGFKVHQQSPLAQEQDSRAAIMIYDVIDPWWGVSADHVNRALLGLDVKDIDVYINSPGGDVFEATAIHTGLTRHPANIHVHIDGLAASAATRVAMAGNTIEIAESGFYMIHHAWTFGFGNQFDFIQTADMLEKVDGTIIADYVNGTDNAEQQIKDWMKAETWFTGKEAVEHGFAHSLIQAGGGASNSASMQNRAWDLSVYDNAPKIEQPNNNPFPQRDRLQRFASMLQRIG